MIELLASYLIVGCALAYITYHGRFTDHRPRSVLICALVGVACLWPIAFVVKARAEWKLASRRRVIANIENRIMQRYRDVKRALA